MANDELMPLDVSELELRSQGRAVGETLAKEGEHIAAVASAIAKGRLRRLLMVGSGDSYYSAMSVRYAAERLTGHPCEAIEAIEAAEYLARDVSDTVALLVSSSGRSPTTVRAMKALRSAGARTVAVTNSPDSPIAGGCELQLYVHATRDGFPTQASTAAMATLLRLYVEMGRELDVSSSEREDTDRALARLPEHIDSVVERTREPMARLAESLLSGPPPILVGAGPSFGVAAFGLAKLKEASQEQATLLGLEEYNHIEWFALREGQHVILVAPHGASLWRAVDIADRCSRCGVASLW